MSPGGAGSAPPPLVLVAEVTHRCPLQCLYCSNPLELTRAADELSTDGWRDVLAQAAQLGVLQVLYSGGEPLLRPDLPDLLRAGREHDLYQTLITSGVGLTPRRLADLRDCGLDAVQLSLQSLDAGTARRVCGGDFLSRKLEAARTIREAGLPLVLNVVLHAMNLHEVPDLLAFAVASGAERIELANTQYYGWGLQNRPLLMPDREALVRAEEVVVHYRSEHPELVIQWVVPDYFADTPKPCMGGWASTHLIVAPDGRALPCPAAYVLPDLPFPDVRVASLGWIWSESEAFMAFRGTGWMRDPCRTCEHRHEDHGGCRCQAYLLTKDARATDPVCRLSPDRFRIDEAVVEVVDQQPLYRPRTA